MKSQRIYKATRRPALPQRCDPEVLHQRVSEIRLAIARRAYELFEDRGGEPGRDWGDWLRAESELVRPVSVVVSETADRIVVHANVLGFCEDELKLAIEPFHVTIYGKKGMTITESEGGKVEYIDWSPDQICRVIALPNEIDPRAAGVKLDGGLLKFDLLKSGCARRRKQPSEPMQRA